MNNRSREVLSFGTVYLDVDLLHFPFIQGLYAQREVVGKEYSLEVGGSPFNFAKICCGLGLDVLFVGKIGTDPTGSMVEQLAEQTGVATDFVKSPEVQTNLAIHYINDEGVSIMTSAGNANQDLNPQDIENTLYQYLPHTQYLYLGGGLKLLKLLEAYPELVSLAKQHGVKIVLDHGRITNLVGERQKEIIKSIYPHIDLYLPSKDEFLDLWSFTDVEQGLQELDPLSPGVIVVKDSDNGAYSMENGQLIHVPALPVKPINTVGAGDSFNAGFVKAHSLGEGSLADQITFASACAALKISTNEIPTYEAVQHFLQQLGRRE